MLVFMIMVPFVYNTVLLMHKYVLPFAVVEDYLYSSAFLYLIQSLPIALIISTFVTYYYLIRNNELLILKNLAMSNYRIAMPSIVALLIVLSVMIWSKLFIYPDIHKSIFNFQYKVSKIASYNLKEKIFNQVDSNVTVYVGSIENKNTLKKVILFLCTEDESIVYTAEQASIFKDNKANRIILHLNEGTLVTDANKFLSFKKMVLPINITAKDFKLSNSKLISSSNMMELIDNYRRPDLKPEINKFVLTTLVNLLLLIPLILFITYILLNFVSTRRNNTKPVIYIFVFHILALGLSYCTDLFFYTFPSIVYISSTIIVLVTALMLLNYDKPCNLIGLVD